MRLTDFLSTPKLALNLATRPKADDPPLAAYGQKPPRVAIYVAEKP